MDEDNCSNDVRYCTNAQLCFELSLTSYSNFEISGNSAFNNEEMAEAKRRGLSCGKVPSSRKERDQEWVPFGCDTERCREFTKCVINEKNTRCLYGSGSAITGGVEFEKGPSFYIEWLPEYFNKAGKLIKNDEDLYNRRVLVVDGEGERTLKFFTDAAKKENVLALVFRVFMIVEKFQTFRTVSFQLLPFDALSKDIFWHVDQTTSK